MIPTLAFAANALMNFVIGLLVAKFLGPAAFGVYAIGAALMVLLNVAFLDWLKHSAVRFYTPGSGGDYTTTRRSLDSLFTASTLGLGVLVAAAWLGGVNAYVPLHLMLASAVAAIGGGLFDYCQAIVRARKEGI